MQILNDQQVYTHSNDKALLETWLGYRLYDVFNSEPIRFYLKSFVRPAAEHLAVLAMRNPALAGPASQGRIRLENSVIEFCCRKNHFLDVWRLGGGGTYPQKLRQVVHNWNVWTAADCSDLIRLYGEVNEHWALRHVGLIGPVQAAHQDGTRPDHPDGFVWRRGRRRGRAWGPPLVGGHTWGARAVWAYHRGGNATAGMGRFRLHATSTVRKIDQLFGLPEGADISGTTADSIFFTEHVDRFLDGMALGGVGTQDLATALEYIDYFGDAAQLLPMATMVFQGHHSVLECALTLTLNGYINYSIGSYTSLMPAGAPDNWVTQRIMNELVWAETHQWNHRMLCFYNPNYTLGAYLYGLPNLYPELANYQRFASTSMNFMRLFYNLPPLLTRDLVDDLKGTYGL